VEEERVVLAHHQGARGEPERQLLEVARGQQPLERVAFPHLADARGQRQEVDVVVAEHDGRALAQVGNEAEHFERARPAVD
jgi:hypothetical protein